MRRFPRFSAGRLATVLVFAVFPAANAVSLSIDEAIQLALQKNPRVQVSAFSRDIARAGVLQQLGHFDPALTFRRTYGQDDLPVSSNPIVTQFTQRDDYSLSLDGIMPWGLTYSLGGTATN